MTLRLIYSVAIAGLLALTACSEPEKADRNSSANQPVPDASLSEQDAARGELSAPPRPVRIGELGPRFDACTGTGRVTRGSGLSLYEAPFDDAGKKGELSQGQRVYICNSTLDQQWLGIVVVPSAPGDDNAPAQDCGVSSPVRSPRAYEGPCDSGWVEANFVKLIAG